MTVLVFLLILEHTEFLNNLKHKVLTEIGKIRDKSLLIFLSETKINAILSHY